MRYIFIIIMIPFLSLSSDTVRFMEFNTFFSIIISVLVYIILYILYTKKIEME